MNCSNAKCAIKSEKEPFIVCWLCLIVIHAKCAGLNNRTADDLNGNNESGLRWCCKKCRVYDIQFFTFIKSTRLNFEEILKFFLLIVEKFNIYKEIFENPPSFDKFVDQPVDLSPKRKKSLENNSIATSIADTVPALTTRVEPPENTQSITENNPLYLGGPSTSKHSLQNGHNTPRSATSLFQKFYTPINSPLNSVSGNVNGVENPLNSLQPNAAKPLKVVSSKKAIFAARFAAETTTDDVSYYIKSKLNSDIDLTVIKFKYTEVRSKASFKIVVPEDVFDTIVNPDFWPKKTIIHEYIYRENKSNIVHLPARSDRLPKN